MWYLNERRKQLGVVIHCKVSSLSVPSLFVVGTRPFLRRAPGAARGGGAAVLRGVGVTDRQLFRVGSSSGRPSAVKCPAPRLAAGGPSTDPTSLSTSALEATPRGGRGL